MEKFIWNVAFDVHNPHLNDEHKELISLMDMLREKNQSSMDKQQLLESFERIINFTKIHFQDEESYMEKIKYPKLSQHKVIHNHLLASLHGYADEFKKTSSGRFPNSVFDFFRTWLTSHIVLFDKDYAKFKDENPTIK